MDRETAITHHCNRQIAELEARVAQLRNEPSASSGLLGDELNALLRNSIEILGARRGRAGGKKRTVSVHLGASALRNSFAFFVVP